MAGWPLGRRRVETRLSVECRSDQYLQMQAANQQQWGIQVYAKSKNFVFKLKVRTLSTWNLDRIIVFFRVRKFVLQANAESEAPITRRKRRTLKSKFLGVFKKLGLRCTKKLCVSSENRLNLTELEVKSFVQRLRGFAYKVWVYTIFELYNLQIRTVSLLRSWNGWSRTDTSAHSGIYLLFFFFFPPFFFVL